MRILIAYMAMFLLLSCQPKSPKTDTPLPTVAERTGIYKSATVYAASTDYAFEIDEQIALVRVNVLDSLLLANVPSNLTVLGEEGPPIANPLLIGQKYKLTYGPQEKLKGIELVGAHDPSDPALPALPEVYSGMVPTGPNAGNRAYFNIFSDLTAILLIPTEYGQQPIYKAGRWTRIADGQKVSAQFGDDIWIFNINRDTLNLSSPQMGETGIRFVPTPDFDLCYYVRNWLSDLSTIDDQPRINPANMTNETPLSEVLTVEHAYMALYGELEVVFKVSEERISKTLRSKPTVQGVCDLVMQSEESAEGH